MQKLRTLLFVLATALLSACQSDATFRYEGAGADLYTPDVAVRTDKVHSYFYELCRKGLPRNKDDTCRALDLTDAQWRILVTEGFNDIDLRCNDYMNWLAAKQSEKFIANQAATGLTAVLGGLTAATGAAKEIGYAALALGFSANVYNAYHDVVLLGLGASNVIALVDARRAKLRAVLTSQDVTFSSLPDAEFALRRYLRICTPAAIIEDFSISAPSSASGQQNPVDARIQDTPKAISTYTPAQSTYTPAQASDRPSSTRPRGRPARTADVERVLLGPQWSTEELRTLQSAFCIPAKERGFSDPRTIANVNLAVTGSELGATSNVNRIDRVTYNRITDRAGIPAGQTELCDPAHYRNGYENAKYRGAPADEKTDLMNMQNFVSPGKTPPMALSEPAARNLVGEVRRRCGLDNVGVFANQITPELLSRFNNPKMCGR